MPPTVRQVRESPAVGSLEATPARTRKVVPGAFKSFLSKEIGGLKFSGHALDRLSGRSIDISPAEAARLGAAVDKAARKGANTSLVLIDDLALVVSIKNRTVITVADSDHLKENVFTNIDSAVIV